MAIIARINTTGSIGRATIKSSPKTSIAADTFAPKPNVSISEINDVSVAGVENGDALVYNSTTGKFEAKPVTATVIEVIGGTF